MASKTKKKCPTCGFEGGLARFVPVRAKKDVQKTVKETSGKILLICPNCAAYVGTISKEEAEKALADSIDIKKG